jgi:hypothetical protein
MKQWLRDVLDEATISVRADHKLRSMTLEQKRAFIADHAACTDGTCPSCRENEKEFERLHQLPADELPELVLQGIR